MLNKCINFTSATAIALKLWYFDKMIREFWEYFHCACTQTAIWELLGPHLQRIIKVLHMSYLR